jgi:glycosyltransferase involved in cell wall biosynthesis
MRLTVLNQFYVPDIAPTGKLAASLADHRAALGDQVTVVTSRGGYVANSRMESRTESDNPRVHRIWTPALGKGSALKRIIDYAVFYLSAAARMTFLRRQDVIVSMTTPPFIALTAALHKLFHRRARLVLWVMDCYPDVMERFDVIREGGLASRLLRALNRFLFRRVDALVTLDGSMEALLLGEYVASGRELPSQVIPNWERADEFPADREAPDWEEAGELGLADNFVVLYSGNAGFGHTFDAVLGAARQLRGEPVRFLFIGGGKRREEIEAAQREHDLDNLVLQGYLPTAQARAAMGLASCSLITLHDDSLGVMSPSKLHSNLASSLPVIYVGPRGSNVDEAIERFGCGVSLRPDDADGLVRFVRGLLADPAKHQRLRTSARAAFEAAYCDTRTLLLFDQLFAELAPRCAKNRHSLPE